MLHYLIELALLLLVAYALGVILGWILRFALSSDAGPVREPVPQAAYAVPEPVAMPAEPPVARMAAPAPAPSAPAPAKTIQAAAAPVAEAEPEPQGKGERPKGIAAARGGKADKLQRISGVGPKNEKILHGLGIFHFDQIASWSREQVAWVDDHLKFNGRIKREDWIKQARLLAEGKEAEFAKLFGSGGMKNSEGQKTSGTRTRRS